MNITVYRRKLTALSRFGSLLLFALLAFSFAAAAGAQSESKSSADQSGLDPIRSYISEGWNTLTRSLSECKTIVDPKITGTSVLYVPADFEVPSAVEDLQQKCHIQVHHLPSVIHSLGQIDPAKVEPDGLLYLENRYVVPGGRFNEMYGWDSYFIIRGLVQDHRVDLAQGMVENFFFEIEHYGAVLNANRTYYLTRSQPPFLTSMILAVYEAQKAAGHDNRAWLEKAYGYAKRDHALWTSEAHLAGDTGLSRYYDFGLGPAPESLKDETGHYREVAAFFLAQPDRGGSYFVQKSPSEPPSPQLGPAFNVQACDVAKTMTRSECSSAGAFLLSADYYKGDRAMRESGFDISFRFGPYGDATHHYAPVCLNSLLYKTEKDLEHIGETLGHKEEATQWRKRAEERKSKIQQYLWDQQRGMYFDYQFETRERSTYEYITTFYPLWAGIATPEQAKAVLEHLNVFERPGGMVMSAHETGSQWDYPYVWAPTQMVALEGMRRYAFNAAADRVSYQFLSNVAENFRRDGTIREKYNAVTRSSETQVSAGYHMNVVGFGWTNAAFLVLLHELPPDSVARLAAEQNVALHSAN